MPPCTPDRWAIARAASLDIAIQRLQAINSRPGTSSAARSMRTFIIVMLLQIRCLCVPLGSCKLVQVQMINDAICFKHGLM
jgi:hypothetical protein